MTGHLENVRILLVRPYLPSLIFGEIGEIGDSCCLNLHDWFIVAPNNIYRQVIFGIF